MPPEPTSRPRSPRPSLLTAHIERRREDRELRRILGTRALHPSQLAVLVSSGDQSAMELRAALAKARNDQRGVRLPLERAIEDEPRAAVVPVHTHTPAPAEARPALWSGDAVAQAQTLREASRNGVPFCAICEAARRERAGRPA